MKVICDIEIPPSLEKKVQRVYEEVLEHRKGLRGPLPRQEPVIEVTALCNYAGQYNPKRNRISINLCQLYSDIEQDPLLARFFYQYLIWMNDLPAWSKQANPKSPFDFLKITGDELAEIVRDAISWNKNYREQFESMTEQYIRSEQWKTDVWKFLEYIGDCKEIEKPKKTIAHELDHAAFHDGNIGRTQDRLFRDLAVIHQRTRSLAEFYTAAGRERVVECIALGILREVGGEYWSALIANDGQEINTEMIEQLRHQVIRDVKTSSSWGKLIRFEPRVDDLKQFPLSKKIIAESVPTYALGLVPNALGLQMAYKSARTYKEFLETLRR